MIGTRQAPPEVLVQLRAIDPKADVVHLDGPSWLLGVRAENVAARDRIDKQLKQIVATPNTVEDPADRAMIARQIACEFELLQLYAKGFRPIQVYKVGPRLTTWGELVEDFRLRDFNWRTRPREAFAELQDAVSLEAGNARRAERMREYVQAVSKDVWRRVFGKAKSFVLGALPSNAGGRMTA